MVSEWYPDAYHAAEERKDAVPRQYWLIFKDSADRERAYNVLKRAEKEKKRPDFFAGLLGYSFDAGNKNGIEMDFKNIEEDTRAELLKFFGDNKVAVTHVYSPEETGKKENVVPFEPRERKIQRKPQEKIAA